jgi:hypothetical protein
LGIRGSHDQTSIHEGASTDTQKGRREDHAEENLWGEKVPIRGLKGVVALRAIEGEGLEGAIALKECGWS